MKERNGLNTPEGFPEYPGEGEQQEMPLFPGGVGGEEFPQFPTGGEIPDFPTGGFGETEWVEPPTDNDIPTTTKESSGTETPTATTTETKDEIPQVPLGHTEL